MTPRSAPGSMPAGRVGAMSCQAPPRPTRFRRRIWRCRSRSADPINASILDGVAKGTIVDDEPVPTASMVRSSHNMHECSGQVLDGVLIGLSPVADRSLVVELVVSGPAEPGVDYAALPATVTIHSGSSQVGLPVTIYEDSVFESAETIDISLVAVGSVIRVDPDAADMQIVISDNDPAPKLSVRGGTGTEGGQNHGTSPVAGQGFANVVFELELRGQVGSDFTVQYETEDGTEQAGADYTAVAGTATIPVGQTVDSAGSVAVGESWYDDDPAIVVRVEYRINARRDVDRYEVTLRRRYGGTYYIAVTNRIPFRVGHVRPVRHRPGQRHAYLHRHRLTPPGPLSTQVAPCRRYPPPPPPVERSEAEEAMGCRRVQRVDGAGHVGIAVAEQCRARQVEAVDPGPQHCPGRAGRRRYS